MTGRSNPPRNIGGPDEPIVYVVDDDVSVREALRNLFRSVGLRVEVFGSAPEFLQSKLADVPSCLILDIRLPRVSGLDFQADLAEAGIHIPIIFMTGHGDIPMTVRAMKAGGMAWTAAETASIAWATVPRSLPVMAPTAAWSGSPG